MFTSGISRETGADLSQLFVRVFQVWALNGSSSLRQVRDLLNTRRRLFVYASGVSEKGSPTSYSSPSPVSQGQHHNVSRCFFTTSKQFSSFVLDLSL